MKSWNMRNVPEDEKKDFIIACLSDYIREVDEMKSDGLSKYHYPEIFDVAELYKVIIELIGG